MKVLVTGRGTSGSWQIRGMQLGTAIGATLCPAALDVAGFDLAVLVKRPAPGLVERLQRADVRIVWDVVDSWPQPIGNAWDHSTCMAWLDDQVRAIRPAAIVAATQVMAEDCAHFGIPVLWLPHHARPKQRMNPVHDHVRTVGYEGGEHYLGKWRPVLERECAVRGWRFVVNPAQLADVDIVVALRDTAGYAPRNWKSNVKLANAQGTGTPFIGNREAGYAETASGGETWADTEIELARALDSLANRPSRKAANALMRTRARTLEHTATEYAAWLSTLNS